LNFEFVFEYADAVYFVDDDLFTPPLEPRKTFQDGEYIYKKN